MFLRLLTSSLPACNLKEIRLKLRWGAWVCETRILFFAPPDRDEVHAKSSPDHGSL
ncbi:hypothetical protein TRIATDRAFT_297077 [Trichoderma atroviride IMI 206040]|uniref:Uncharacterized protein n=1 Tax=Hypocrea atroviridis (strain ATCC 20476 / IMI 206040) TaxID=452589 RepID=G9NFK4_HYPAI|nr:uncharacterized protein TRIATDRAFT_297077 [Trichoderma atroviride IMI 206040]EHK50719.1 hypothetical protein TRIATDRAFT_297077 [Trichoderma atroviride IMI 206040]